MLFLFIIWILSFINHFNIQNLVWKMPRKRSDIDPLVDVSSLNLWVASPIIVECSSTEYTCFRRDRTPLNGASHDSTPVPKSTKVKRRATYAAEEAMNNLCTTMMKWKKVPVVQAMKDPEDEEVDVLVRNTSSTCVGYLFLVSLLSISLPLSLALSFTTARIGQKMKKFRRLTPQSPPQFAVLDWFIPKSEVILANCASSNAPSCRKLLPFCVETFNCP